MSQDTVTLYKWFWADQDEQQEQWLRARAAEGLHLHKVAHICGWTFKKGDPTDVAYRIDYQSSNSPQYRDLFEDAGWECVGASFGWHYWRKADVNGKAEEIFTDNASKIEKYRRVLMMLALAIMPLTLLMLGPGPTNFFGALSPISRILFSATILLVFPIYVYGTVRLYKRIRALRKAA